jgi:hypothetical protein
VERRRVTDPAVAEHRRRGQSRRQDPLVELADGDFVEVGTADRPPARHGGQDEERQRVLGHGTRIERAARYRVREGGLPFGEGRRYQQRGAAERAGRDELTSGHHEYIEKRRIDI